jgi:hypothetical protein
VDRVDGWNGGVVEEWRDIWWRRGKKVKTWCRKMRGKV